MLKYVYGRRYVHFMRSNGLRKWGWPKRTETVINVPVACTYLYAINSALTRSGRNSARFSAVRRLENPIIDEPISTGLKTKHLSGSI